MSTVNLIAAIGRQGQLGLDGSLPWHNSADLAFFKRVTTGGTMIVGRITSCLMPVREIARTRRIEIYGGRNRSAEEMIRIHNDRPVWIAGGAATYRAFAPFVDGVKIISLIDYDGPADTWFPFDAYGMKDLRV
jgi:dihydrofolate reductase